MKKKKTKTRQDYIRELDLVFSKFIRLRDCNDKGIVVCPLCGAKVPRKQSQNMHFVSRGVLKHRFDENNCFAGCLRCNVILHGNYIAYTRFMQNKFGIAYVDKLIADKGPCKISTPILVEMIHYYTKRAEILLQKKKLF